MADIRLPGALQQQVITEVRAHLTLKCGPVTDENGLAAATDLWLARLVEKPTKKLLLDLDQPPSFKKVGVTNHRMQTALLDEYATLLRLRSKPKSAEVLQQFFGLSADVATTVIAFFAPAEIDS